MNWIKVSERLPKDGENVMIYSEPSSYCFWGIFISTFEENKFKDWPPNCGCSGFSKVSHWMPLPEPPEDSE